MTRDELVRELARAICEARDYNPDLVYPMNHFSDNRGAEIDVAVPAWYWYKESAHAILARLDALGLYVCCFPHGEAHTGACPTCGVETIRP